MAININYSYYDLQNFILLYNYMKILWKDILLSYTFDMSIKCLDKAVSTLYT